MNIQFPKVDFKLKEDNGIRFIWDEVRLKWVKLTPEEWVRQNFIQYLLLEKKYPSALMAIEKGIVLNELKKRCDIVLYKNSAPWLIVECKETEVPLTEKTLMQILRYNMSLPVPFLVITNGNQTFGWHRIDGQLEPLEELPTWSADEIK